MSVIIMDMRKEWEPSKEEMAHVIIASASLQWAMMHRKFKEECQHRLDEYKDLTDLARSCLILDFISEMVEVLPRNNCASN